MTVHLPPGPLAVVWLDDVGRGLRQGAAMFWQTLWPLVLGFGLSGFVRSFVPTASVQRRLGNHRPAAVARASGYGMASSSCSYAATSMARALFAKGADFVSAMVFMFASTNLVIELGIVLLVLLGWEFMAGELFGGVVMIVLLAGVGGLVFGGRVVDRARARATDDDHASTHAHHGTEPDPAAQPWAERLRARGKWVDAATFAISDLTMLRKELLIGYGVAGFLAALVPTHVWQVVFLHGHGAWTTLENALVGPLVAMVSFVCSVGNVPLAAALWRGGISFGGVISFVFADLITFPLLLIYRRYYGTRCMLRMLAAFWAVMSLAGLVTEGAFRALGIVPSVRPGQPLTPGFQWDATTWLDLVALAVLALAYWAYRNRDRLGGGEAHALDPVCGMQVARATAPVSVRHAGTTWYFCSERCAGRFRADPSQWAARTAAGSTAGHAPAGPDGDAATLPGHGTAGREQPSPPVG